LKERKYSYGRIRGGLPIASRKDILYLANKVGINARDGWTRRDKIRLSGASQLMERRRRRDMLTINSSRNGLDTEVRGSSYLNQCKEMLIELG